jgi:hypothetical protein
MRLQTDRPKACCRRTWPVRRIPDTRPYAAVEIALVDEAAQRVAPPYGRSRGATVPATADSASGAGLTSPLLRPPNADRADLIGPPGALAASACTTTRASSQSTPPSSEPVAARRHLHGSNDEPTAPGRPPRADNRRPVGGKPPYAHPERVMVPSNQVSGLLLRRRCGRLDRPRRRARVERPGILRSSGATRRPLSRGSNNRAHRVLARLELTPTDPLDDQEQHAE